ncbi:MAG: hemagglutinin repeat-containing protein, partial [Betaproteobacteria bacterium]|nr:hemagglutinin repeat-containing protein [Betaproteobacteria bacterium]
SFSFDLREGIAALSYDRYTGSLAQQNQAQGLSTAQIGSLGGDLFVLAQGDIHTSGAFLSSANDLILQGQDIRIGSIQTLERDGFEAKSRNRGIQINIDLVPIELKQLRETYRGIDKAFSGGSFVDRLLAFDQGNQRAFWAAIEPVVAIDALYTKGKDSQEVLLTRTTGSGLLAAGNLLVQAEQDLNIEGSTLFGETGVLLGGQNVSILDARGSLDETAQRTLSQHGMQTEGAARVFIGYKSWNDLLDSAKATSLASQIGSGGDVLIEAQGDYVQRGSELSAAGDIAIGAQSILIAAAEPPYQWDEEHRYRHSGIRVALNVPIADAHDKARRSASRVGQSNDDRINTLAVANTAWDAYQAYQLWSNGGKDGNGNLFNVSITYTYQDAKDTAHSEGNRVSPSQVRAGGTLSLSAWGAGEHSNIAIIGSDVSGLLGTWLAAENRIDLLAAGTARLDESDSRSAGGNIGVALSFDNGISLGITAGGNYGYGYGDGEEIVWRNTHVGHADSPTVLQSGGLTTLRGAQVLGHSVDLDVGGLHIESLQDTSTFQGHHENAYAQVTIGYGFSASGGYGQSDVKADYASVIEPSGILAGDGGYRINVQGNTHLAGGLITSTQQAEDEGLNRFTTGTLTAVDLHNLSQYKGTAYGIGMSAGKNNKDNKSWESSIGYGHDSHKETSVTPSGINTANIAITDEAGQQRLTGQSVDESIAAIHTDITTDDAHAHSGALQNKFDKDEVFREIELQVDVTREFQRNANAAIGAYYDAKQAELREKLHAVLNDRESTPEQRIAAAEALYGTAYQRAFLQTLVALISGAPPDVFVTQGLLQQAAIKMREESFKNSALFKGVVDAKDPDGKVFSNLSMLSGWFDGIALGGVRITLDTICGKANERCRREKDEFGDFVIGPDGLPKLELDKYGHVQFDGDENYPTLTELFSTLNEDTAKMYGATGGSQAIPGYMFSRTWGAYDPGDFFDLLVESFAGTHDFIGGQITGLYDEQGNTSRGRSNLTEKAIDTWAVIAVFPAAPFALSDLVSSELMQILFKTGGK